MSVRECALVLNYLTTSEAADRPTQQRQQFTQSISQSSDVYLEVLTIVLARDLEGRALPHLHAVALREACGV